MKKKSNCIGCMACLESCHLNCIKITRDKGGNFYQVKDASVCVQCGQCDKVCPLIDVNNLNYPNKAYIAWNKNRNLNKRSASGGIAVAIYRYCLQNGIICVGVKFDSNQKARYGIISDLKELEMYVSSKYVYSHMGKIYIKILNLLRKGEKVLFIGLPCHVSALKKWLHQEYKNLFLVDLVCHGTVPENILLKHIYKFKGVCKENIGNICFREADNQYGITIKGKNNQILKKITKDEDKYMIAFCNGISYFEQCYMCKYARKERCSDITLKDFSGKKFGSLIKERDGLSSILVNTNKGDELLKKISTSLNIIEYSVEKTIQEDNRLQKTTKKSMKKRLYDKLFPIVGFDLSITILYGYQLMKGKIKRYWNEK